MSGVRVLVGTRKGAFILTADGKREKWDVSGDKLTYTFTLRDGLLWHDGQPVTAEDCIASIKRWGIRDTMVWKSENGARAHWRAIGEGNMDMAGYFKRWAELCADLLRAGFGRE